MPPSDSTALVGAAVGSGVDLRKTTPNRATSTPHHLTATSTPSSPDEASKFAPSAARCTVDASQSDRRHMSVQVQRRPVPPGGRSAATTDTTPARDQDPRNLQTIQYKSNAERSSARSDRFSTTSTSRSIVPGSAKSARPREDGDRRGADISLRPPQDPHPSYGKFQSTTHAVARDSGQRGRPTVYPEGLARVRQRASPRGAAGRRPEHRTVAEVVVRRAAPDGNAVSTC